MAVTETTTVSWGSRLGGSIKGVFFGFLLFILAIPVLFWNEDNSVKTAKAIDEGEGACIALDSNEKVDPEMNGKLVHLTGKADTKDVLVDDQFGVSVTAISLERTVEMYQWIEESKTTETKKLGGGVEKKTTYKYTKDWSGHAIDSSRFYEQGHDNPAAMEFESGRMYASNVSFGAFKLSDSQIKRIGAGQDYSFPTGFVCRVARVQQKGKTIYVPNAKTRGEPLNNRDVLEQPRVGDMRVTFHVVYPHDISIIAKQHGDTFVDYMAKNRKKLNYLENGVKDAAEMFDSARSSNKFFTWLIRIGGFLMMFFGLSMTLKPISVMADVIPILGDIAEIGNGLVAGLVAFICAVVTIAVAWLFYRPVIGGILLVLAGAAIWMIIQKRKAAKAAKAVAASRTTAA